MKQQGRELQFPALLLLGRRSYMRYLLVSQKRGAESCWLHRKKKTTQKLRGLSKL